MRQLLFIPCKPFFQAKTRLSAVLDMRQREELARALYLHTLSAVSRSTATQCGGFEAIVISSDAEVLALARKAGLGTVAEKAALGLNEALRTAISCFPRDADMRYAYLPTDLPDLKSGDLDELASPGSGACVIAPDINWQGTNFLSWPIQLDLRLTLGSGSSFSSHYLQVRRHTPHVRVIAEGGLRRDLDVPEDLLHNSNSVLWTKAQPYFSRSKCSAAIAAARMIEQLEV